MWNDSRHREASTIAGMARRTEAERFWSKVDKIDPEGCWLWTAGRDEKGYGTFRLTRGKMTKAHRWSYIDAFGDHAPGLELDHLCKTRACVRPDHLEPVTHRENIRRAMALDVCRRCGQAMELYGGSWCCRSCTRKRLNEWQQRKRRAEGAVPGGPGSRRRAQTHCIRGHAFTPENTITNDKGWRWCRECSRIRAAKRRAAKRS